MGNALLRTFFALFFIFAAGCSSVCSTGCVSQNTSLFNKESEVIMTPGYVYKSARGISGSDMRIGAYWSSALRRNQIVLIVMPHKDQPVGGGTPLLVNIDGAVTKLISVQKEQIESLKPSQNADLYFNPRVIDRLHVLYYPVDIQFVENMLGGEDVKVRIDLQNTYVEGVFSHNSSAAAKPSLADFLGRVKGR